MPDAARERRRAPVAVARASGPRPDQGVASSQASDDPALRDPGPAVLPIPRARVRRVRRRVAAARGDDVFLYSAALAFYGLISVAPLVVVALWVTSLLVTDRQVQEIADDLARFAPGSLGADRALERTADAGTSLGLVALVAALWPATAYGSALAGVLNRLAGDRTRTALRGRGAALLLVGLVPVLMLLSLVASYAGAAALGDSGVEVVVGLVLALASGFVATVTTVAIVYRTFPRRPPPWRETLTGAFVAAGCISTLSAAYAAYLRLGVDFESRYASDALAAVVLLGLWLFAANSALLLTYRIVCVGGSTPASGSDGTSSRNGPTGRSHQRS